MSTSETAAAAPTERSVRILEAACTVILRDGAQGIANLEPTGGINAMQQKAGLLEQVDQEFLDEYQAEAIQAKLAGYRKAEFDLKIEFYKQKIDELTAMVARSQADVAGYRDRFAAAAKLEQIRQELEQIGWSRYVETQTYLGTKMDHA